MPYAHHWFIIVAQFFDSCIYFYRIVFTLKCICLFYFEYILNVSCFFFFFSINLTECNIRKEKNKFVKKMQIENPSVLSKFWII